MPEEARSNIPVICYLFSLGGKAFLGWNFRLIFGSPPEDSCSTLFGSEKIRRIVEAKLTELAVALGNAQNASRQLWHHGLRICASVGCFQESLACKTLQYEARVEMRRSDFEIAAAVASACGVPIKSLDYAQYLPNSWKRWEPDHSDQIMKALEWLTAGRL